MGMALHRTFVDAGLGPPAMSLHTPVGGAPDWLGFDYMADSFRSLLPLLEQYGIATAAEVDVATLAARLRADVVASGIPLMLFPDVGAWARKPG
jgi:hypothetical protein